MAVGQVSGHSGTGMGVFSKNCALLLSFFTPFSHKLSAGHVQKLHQDSHDITNTMGDLGLKFQPHRKFLDSTNWPKTSKNGLAGAPNGTGFARFAPILTHPSLKTLKLAGINDITSLPTQKSRLATWPPAIWPKNASFGLLGWNGTLNAAIFNVFTASGFSTPIGFWGGAEFNSAIRFSSRDHLGGHFSSFVHALKNTQNGVFSAFSSFFHRVVAQISGHQHGSAQLHATITYSTLVHQQGGVTHPFASPTGGRLPWDVPRGPPLPPRHQGGARDQPGQLFQVEFSLLQYVRSTYEGEPDRCDFACGGICSHACYRSGVTALQWHVCGCCAPCSLGHHHMLCCIKGLRTTCKSW
jgi:hypothetical protein